MVETIRLVWNLLRAVSVSSIMNWMIRTLIATIAATAWAVSAAVGLSGVASATSCAGIEHGDARSVVSGVSIGEGYDGTLYTIFDLAISGTVTEIATDEVPGSATYGATEVSFEVINAFGVDTISPTLVVWSSDPGWMSGYPFEVGRTYFVPLKNPGMSGHPYESFLCDPISEISPEDATSLKGFAPDGVPTATPTPARGTTESATVVPAPAPDAGARSAVAASVEMTLVDEDQTPARAWALGLGAVGIAAVLVMVVRRSRRIREPEIDQS